MSDYLSLPRIENSVWLSSRDRLSLLAQLDEKKASAAELSFRIKNLEPNGDLDKLTQQHNKELTEITSICNILAPVRRLHPELLSEIFHQVGALEIRTDRDTRSTDNVKRLMHVYVTMSHVCFVWRVTAHSTSDLWTEYIDHSRRTDIDLFAAMIPNFLQYSGALPILVDLDLRPYGRDEVSRIIDSLVPFCPHIRLLRLYLPFEGNYPADLPPASFALLEELEFIIASPPRKQRTKAKIPRSDRTFFRECSQLRRFKSRGDSNHWWTPLTLPCNQILELDLGCSRHPRHVTPLSLATLREFSNVTSLILSFRGFEPEALHLPALTSLDLATIAEGCPAFIDSLTAPNLISLKLSFWLYYSGTQSPFAHLLAFHRRCAPPIKELTLSNVGTIETNELITFLALFPLIEKLELLDCMLVKGWRLFPALKFSSQHAITPLVPKLTWFGWGESHDLNEENDQLAYDVAFAEFVESRWWPDMQEHRAVMRLQKVHFASPERGVWSKKDSLPRVEACDGLDLSVDWT